MCPLDNYKIYKSGSNIRIDATLIDIDEWYRCKRGNQSFDLLKKIILKYLYKQQTVNNLIILNLFLGFK